MSDASSPEIRVSQGNKLVKVLDKLQAPTVLAEPETRASFFRSVTTEQAVGWITNINGIVRALAGDDRSLDGSGVIQGDFGGQKSIEYIPPDPQIRSILLRETIEQIRQVPDSKYQAYALGLAINLIHPFSDGNGRTSRIISMLIRDGYDGTPLAQETLKNLFIQDKKDHSICVNPDVIAHYGYDYYFKERISSQIDDDKLPNRFFIDHTLSDLTPEALPLNQDVKVSRDEKQRLVDIIQTGSEGAGFPIIFEFLRERGQADHFTKVPSTGNLPPFIDLDSLLPTLNAQDIQALLSCADRFSADYTRWMVDVFVHPENHRFTVEGGGTFPLAAGFANVLERSIA